MGKIIKKFLKSILDRLPYVRSLKRTIDFYNDHLHVPPGHYYSPIILTEELIKNREKIFNIIRPELSGIDLNLNEQKIVLEKFIKYYSELPFKPQKQKDLYYYYDNTWYEYSDAIFLYSMIRYCKPNKIIEIGSGFSSAVILDTNRLFFNDKIECTFIDPYPERLVSIIGSDLNCNIISQKIQDTSQKIFSELEENDILLIDSSHVVKAGSDVNILLFEILPKLNKGVKIHFHDIFYPFQYPEEWLINQKRSWNECYFLQAFLMHNNAYKIIAFNTYLELCYKGWFEKYMPLCLNNTGGSLWLEKVIDCG